MKPIFSAACPCCACTLVDLHMPVGEDGKPLSLYGKLIGPITWNCSECGFAMLGLAVPIRPQFRTVMRTCLDVIENTEVWSRNATKTPT